MCGLRHRWISPRFLTESSKPCSVRDEQGAPEDAEAHESLALLKAALLIGWPRGCLQQGLPAIASSSTLLKIFVGNLDVSMRS